MVFQCEECETEIDVSSDNVTGEIMSCPMCGVDYVITVDEKGLMILKELSIEGEDWGE
jgi:Zn finger protein HypA/HybF involved in hydrogenase expression